MLSLTVFAAAASAATQAAPATRVAPPDPPLAGKPEVAAGPNGAKPHRDAIVWRFADPEVDGGQIWL
ncbi:MAG TPA: hypothetical protein VFR60_04485 [Sphingomicrobium sp.]|nr:hypothetical protein [Sphingomicrobium sp.]